MIIIKKAALGFLITNWTKLVNIPSRDIGIQPDSKCMGRNPKNEEVTSLINRNINSVMRKNTTNGLDVIWHLKETLLVTSEQQ